MNYCWPRDLCGSNGAARSCGEESASSEETASQRHNLVDEFLQNDSIRETLEQMQDINGQVQDINGQVQDINGSVLVTKEYTICASSLHQFFR